MLKLFKHLRHCKRYAFFAMLFVSLQNLITLSLPTIVSKILDEGVDKNDSDYILYMGVAMSVLAVIGCVIGIFGNYFSAKTASNFGANLRKALFVKVTDMGQKEFEGFTASSLITRTTNDIQHLQDLVLIFIKMLIPAPILFIGGTVLSIMYNAKLSLFVLAVIPVILVVVYFLFKVTKKLFDRQQSEMDTINRIVREKLTGIRVVRAFNREKSEDEKFRDTNAQLKQIGLKIYRIFAVVIPLGYFTLYTVLALIMFFGAKEINAIADPTKLSTAVNDLQMFMIFIVMMISGVEMAAAMAVMIPTGTVAAKRINAVLDCEVSIKVSENAVSLKDAEESGAHLVFKNVAFSYPDAEERVLQGINFECNSGETTAIIGSTGAGKSTLINLIPRFFDVSEGEISLNGINLKELDPDELRDRIGLVPQKAFLFSGTVADNIRYGKRDADEKEIWAALDTAKASDFIHAKKHGLETMVSQGGKNFSGGQRQRLSIARAVVGHKDILIFDDSFSALDFKTESALRNNLKEAAGNANILIVAQRINTVMDADRIIVLDEGKIAGMGTHAELIMSCKAYKEIALSQLSPEEVGQIG